MSGRYLSDREVTASSEESYDEDLRKKLWEASEGLTGLKATV